MTVAKAALRRRMKDALRARPRPLPDVGERLAEWLRERPSLRKLAVFAPLADETDLLPLLEMMSDRVWCFPRILDTERLAFHQVKNADTELHSAAYGIREPSPHAPAVAIGEIDAFLCPGLAFDRCGGRLGRGRGYYDRMLADARADALKVGMCFSFQLVDTTFNEPHDVRMDAVVCELGPLTPAEQA